MSVTWTSKHYFLFDSHSRDINGKIGPDGFSVLLKFSSRETLEQHILETYFKDVNEEYVCFAIQYIKIQLHNGPDFDAKLTYRLETKELTKKSEIQKEKCRKHNQAEIQKEKFRKRNQTEIQKEKCWKRNQTEIQKEKCRKRKQTESEKLKSRERKTTKNLDVSRVSVSKMLFGKDHIIYVLFAIDVFIKNL